MKKEELFEVLGDIDDKYINEARKSNPGKKKTILRWTSLVACAAILISAVFVTPLLTKKPAGTQPDYPKGVVAMAAVYPKAVGVGMTAEEFLESDESFTWWTELRDRINKAYGLSYDMEDYNLELMSNVLVSDKENTVCSPLNTYIAFSMLAEITEGNSRKQILDMLGCNDIQELRKTNKLLWESNYADTPVFKSVLANSLWMNEDIEYNKDTIKTLTDNYYASAFSGRPGSKEYSEALRMWTNYNTGDLLKDYTEGMEIKEDTVMELVSTIYFKAAWSNFFSKSLTQKETFHGVNGDTTVDMMHSSELTTYYSTDLFEAFALDMSDSGSMYFYLPKEGVDVNELASDEEVLKVLHHEYASNNPDKATDAFVNMSVPKFNVSAQTELIDTLTKIGVTDVFDDSVADFSPLTKEDRDLFLSKVDHTAVVEIDEDGVTGAAFTEIAITEGAYIVDLNVDIVLDRPFMFIVKAEDGSVLFSGIVRNIE